MHLRSRSLRALPQPDRDCTVTRRELRRRHSDVSSLRRVAHARSAEAGPFAHRQDERTPSFSLRAASSEPRGLSSRRRTSCNWSPSRTSGLSSRRCAWSSVQAPRLASYCTGLCSLRSWRSRRLRSPRTAGAALVDNDGRSRALAEGERPAVARRKEISAGRCCRASALGPWRGRKGGPRREQPTTLAHSRAPHPS